MIFDDIYTARMIFYTAISLIVIIMAICTGAMLR